MTQSVTSTLGSVTNVIVTDEATLRYLVREEIERAMEPVIEALAHQRRARGRNKAAEPLLTRNDLLKLLKIDIRTLRRMVRAGEVPPPISSADRTHRWRRSTIESFLRKKEARALTSGLRRGSMS